MCEGYPVPYVADQRRLVSCLGAAVDQKGEAIILAERKNDFSKGSIPRNVLNLARLMTAAQLANVLYSVVDRIYLGHLPETDSLALTALGVTISIVTILMSLANLCGTGGALLCPIGRGE